MDQRDDELLASLGLDEELANFVREELEKLEQKSLSNYLRLLLKYRRRNRNRRNVARLVAEGIESGAAAPLTADYWAGIIPGFVAKGSKKVIGETLSISCRPMVSQDLKSLLAEIAPDSDEAAKQFLQRVASTVSAIRRKPTGGIMIAGYEPKGMIRPVEHSVARVAYLATRASGIDVVRILHRDKHQVLKRDTYSVWD